MSEILPPTTAPGATPKSRARKSFSNNRLAFRGVEDEPKHEFGKTLVATAITLIPAAASCYLSSRWKKYFDIAFCRKYNDGRIAVCGRLAETERNRNPAQVAPK